MENNSAEILWLNHWASINGIVVPYQTMNFYKFENLDGKKVKMLAISQFNLPKRNNGTEAFNESRLKSIFDAMIRREALPPIECTSDIKGTFTVMDGFHRFYISTWIGYSHIPAHLDQWFLFET